jgi:hypothetical protein
MLTEARNYFTTKAPANPKFAKELFLSSQYGIN